MSEKMKFLTKISLFKKIKTKWFLIANLFFCLLIIGIVNIDSIINFFGGDFNETQEILVIDESNSFENFKEQFNEYTEYLDDYVNTEIILFEKDYDEGIKLVEDEDNILLMISEDDENYLKAKIVSNEPVGTITNTLISTVLNNIRSQIVLKDYHITEEMYQNINNNIIIETEILSDKTSEEDLTVVSIMQILTIPIFMLIIFLVQMIGAEVNEEKSTKSMEIIISNVSPKTHFLSKVIASNLFVIIQGGLLLLFVIIALIIRYFICDGNLIGEFGEEISQITNTFNLTNISNTLSYMIPILLIMILLTFFAYSLLAGILASMTTNQEDFQQLQTPIVIISLIGYYLSMMASVFKGSLFIKIMSYIPFISSMLSPTLYVLGQINLIDLLASILMLLITIHILIKYGLRIYKVGILNYSGTGLWKKMLKAMKGE